MSEQSVKANRGWRKPLICGALALCAAFGYSQAIAKESQAADETFKIGMIAYLGGPAAATYGEPSVNTAKLVVQALNAGNVPAPYDSKGIGGMPIELEIVGAGDNAYRNLVQRKHVNAVIHVLGSSDCLQDAPLAEELKTFTIVALCGDPQLFAQDDYQYVFRTSATAAIEAVGLARYLIAEDVPMSTVMGVNVDYAYGHSSWKLFTSALKAIAPETKILGSVWPQFGQGHYGTAISKLLQANPDVIFTSLWGGDALAFILQASARGLTDRSQIAYQLAAHILPDIGKRMPEGVIIGERGRIGPFAPFSSLNKWFTQAYKKAYGHFPYSSSAYETVRAILGLKAAAEKAMTESDDQKLTSEELAEAMTGLSWKTPAGTIELALAHGHQTAPDAAFGRTHWSAEKGRVVVTDVRYFKGACVNPPPGMTTEEWIAAGFPHPKGADCGW